MINNKPFNGAMLNLARLRLGMSQKELSGLSGIAQSVISKAEIGLMLPSAHQIAALSDALDIRPSFFFIEEQSYPPLMPIYRKRNVVPQRSIQQTNATGAIISISMNRLMKGADLENVCDLPHLDPDSFPEKAEDIARSIRQFLGIPQGPIVNISGILEDHGVMIFPRADFSAQVDGYTLYPEVFSFPYIFINKYISGERFRMTEAHELGHIVMHKFYTPTSEQEAWDFAGEFMMPYEEFMEDIPSRTTRLSDLLPLKYKWRVSLKAIIYRLRKLEVIQERTQRYLYSQLAKYGKNEPYPIPQEQVELQRNVIEYCERELGYSVEEMEEITGLNHKEFSSYFLPKVPLSLSLQI